MADYNSAIQFTEEDAVFCSEGDESHPISASAVTYSNRGLLLHSLGKYQEALEDFNTAIDLGSKLADAYNNRGIIYFDTGNGQEALEDFNTAIDLDSKLAMTYFNRGFLYAQNGYEQYATEDFQQAAELCRGKETAECRQLRNLLD